MKKKKVVAKTPTCDPPWKTPMLLQSAMSFLVIVCWCGPICVSAILVFDSTALMNEVLIPADAAVGSVIYRLRASDTAFDYPLIFHIKDTTTVAVDPLNCTRFNSVCQANLILRKKLEAGRFYDFRVEVRNQRGQMATMNCSFQATNATTPVERIFPGAPTLLSVSENARRNTELGRIIAKGNPNRLKAVYLELYGTVHFGIHQKLISEKDAEGTIVLLTPLDYETKTVHHLTILANDPWTNMNEDTRNIAGWPLLVAVIDEQDTPPIFTIAPPTTTLSPSLRPGDTILRVHAEDGDRGQPRPIRYSLHPDDETSGFFHISEKTGELTLAVPMSQIISYPLQGQPILLKVTAEEVRSNPQEAPSQSTTVQLALIPPGITLGSPTFGAIEYHALLDENALVGTSLDIPQAEITTEAGDVVTLELMNNNGTFDIAPSVVEGFSRFRITVHDNRLLDYEARHYVECYIVAREVGKGNYTAKAKLTVVLNDVNDNPPVFVKGEFTGTVAEHSPVDTNVLIVEATDVDREPGSRIRYIELTGPGGELFNLDGDTGLITVANSELLDVETYPKISLLVTAADESGLGLTAKATVTINLLDINDNAPQFERDIYEFILNTDRTTFTTQAFIKAFDGDVSPPNNEVMYELLTPNNHLFINDKTGEVLVKQQWDSDELVTVKVRAYDGGVPRQSGDCEVRIYPPESKSRKMIFIVPGKYPDKAKTEETLSALTGGRVVVDDLRPYTGFEPGATYVTRTNGDRSVVVATVHYTKDSVVDVNRIQQLLDGQHTTIQGEEIKQSSSGDLLWLLILFIVLAIIAAIILILCCICRPCPLYIPPKRRKVHSGDMVEKLVKGSGEGRESKSVQVAEWFGRKEAWSADKRDVEAESLRRHEMERGSDKEIKHHARDQLYIREGNTDILRLITRAGDTRLPPNYVEQQHYMVDSGKDILMRRFIDQQGSQTLLPNAVNRLQSEHEFLEASLRQQNAMLRQLIMDRERDLRLETQSLPAGTQTDQDMATQTEPQYLRPPRRRVQSDWELSDDGSDEEIAVIKARARRRHRVMKPRKIKTPIQEESDEMEYMDKQKSDRPEVKHTRTTELRQRRSRSLKQEVLKEISDSLNQSEESDYVNKDYSDSLDDVTPRERSESSEVKTRRRSESLEMSSRKTSPRRRSSESSLKQKYRSESDLRSEREKRSTETDVSSEKKKDGKSGKKTVTKKPSRYMEWYSKSSQKPIPKENKERKKPAEKDKKKPVVESRLFKETVASSKKKADPKKNPGGPDHPLLQHSEHRYEAQYPKNRPEEDADSGIVLAKPEMAQKKSVFTIAYNDIHTSQLRPDSSANTP